MLAARILVVDGDTCRHQALARRGGVPVVLTSAFAPWDAGLMRRFTGQVVLLLLLGTVVSLVGACGSDGDGDGDACKAGAGCTGGNGCKGTIACTDAGKVCEC